ncbi:hypothetical protein [Pedobacter sp. UBA4863]|uniref:hypothetical protein n=1 Tax=Pedobacter sp. UBA4863 TaxID=1947060 RepID=UPI0025D7E764|nr:hypothetical protein [Pedobacter sp. UBA4863]
MKKDNLEYLKEQIKFAGFGDAMDVKLQEMLEKGQPEFTLAHEHSFGRDKVEAQLHFNKSDQGNYFFNKYELMLNKENGEAVKQVFHQNPPKEGLVRTADDPEGTKQWINTNISLKEAFNLLAGRAINKDLVNRQGEAYNSWVQLNFKETEASGNFKKEYFSEKYGYDMEAALKVHPIKELGNDEDRNKLIESLHKGNRQQVTFTIGDKEEKRFLQANPKYKTIDVYDGNTRVRHSQGKEAKEGQEQGKSMKASNAGEDGEGGPKVQKPKRKKTQGIS